MTTYQIIPQPIITTDTFPVLHQLALGDIMVNGQLIPQFYAQNQNSGLPRILTQDIDPANVTGP
jgi:hypothetical protein